MAKNQKKIHTDDFRQIFSFVKGTVEKNYAQEMAKIRSGSSDEVNIICAFGFPVTETQEMTDDQELRIADWVSQKYDDFRSKLSQMGISITSYRYFKREVEFSAIYEHFEADFSIVFYYANIR